ncbi:MAG: hypothetical protein A3J87_00180 [Sideroxydans sp. RIFOXYB12_FULL_59_6]|nr:MAG: hypothetical protein A3J87_00180 [Sideroxydans sp. RIFOXYB12_FULL_59_6]
MICMLPAIDFQYQRSFQTHEINNETPDRVLSTKFASHELFQAQMTPEQLFGIRHVSTQTSSMLFRCRSKSR